MIRYRWITLSSANRIVCRPWSAVNKSRAMDSLRKQFALNLRQARYEAGLSQEALADACDLHRTEISLLERCKRSPRLGRS